MRKMIKKEMGETNVEPDYVCDDFLSGVKWILK